MSKVTLSLNGYDFADLEIPTKITVGGKQKLVVHELVGGARVIDAMGDQLDALSWEGRFRGANAVANSEIFHQWRRNAQPLPLTWGSQSFTVLIESFSADHEAPYEVPYKISCVIVSTPDQSDGASSTIDDAVSADLATANSLASQVGNSTLTGMMTSLGTAVSAVSSFATATQSQIQSVLQPLAAVKAQVNLLIASAANTAQQVATVGGLLPTNPAAQAIGKLTNQVVGFTQVPVLNQLQAVTGRIGLNVQSATSAGQQVPVAGGNLMQMATKAYGDFTSWTGIARANNLSDPVVQGAQVLTVPPTPDNSGGVIGG